MAKVTVKSAYMEDHDFEFAMSLADQDLVEEIHCDLVSCTEQEFFDEYCKRHAEKYADNGVFSDFALVVANA